MRDLRIAAGLIAVAVVTLVGAGACTFGKSGGESGGKAPVDAAQVASGADGSPGPDQATSPTPGTTPTSATPTTVRPSPTRSTVKPYRGCPQGEYQRQVETYLAKLGGFGKITVDGRQSAADCAAIKKFQRRYDIRPPKGRAGPTTYDVARRLAHTDVRKCKAGKGTTFCVDLTHQTAWVMRGGTVVLKPTVVRTGMGGGYQTPAGNFTINYRNIKEWSRPYKVWLPYWQHFVDGMGFHETTTYIHNKAIGSHGCVNLLHTDAVQFWKLGKVGAPVHVFGRRPGT